METFRSRMAKRVGTTGTPIILALDLPLKDGEKTEDLKQRALNLLEATADCVCAVKVNAPLLLPLGIEGVAEILARAHGLGLQTIMDAKINDVGHMNMFYGKTFFHAGFDAVIANPLVGWEEGLQGVFEGAARHQAGVILLAYLSHKAAGESYGLEVKMEGGDVKPLYRVFLERAVAWKADGVVVGATHLEKVREASVFLEGRVPIYSPGVGAQGGSLEACLAAGTTYPIIGRAIVEAEDPGRAALGFKEMVMKARSSLPVK
jgi:orotidine-5'-phosphate decarboxylase